MSHVEREPWKTLRGLWGKGVEGLSKTKTKEKQVGKTHAYRCRPRRALEEESRLRRLVERGGAGPRPRPTLILTPEVVLT